jgi:hypothetical protein
MTTTTQIAKHLREVYFGGNWTGSNFKDNLADVTWQDASTEVYSLNTIATLVFHVNYYVSAVLKVLQGGALEANDKYSFDHPPVSCQEDWDGMLEKIWADAEQLASLIEQLPESTLREDFEDGKYGDYYRNLTGAIEHTHYHLGQIALIKKILLKSEEDH